ncbi:BTAD domain-containing putative transcriptional regulator [Micromonospora aurantiaca (nom. illeg.)]|uniref:BTAD domain-containing putative transcriptional regulator n=1 Tax=Micromonospora aurantiaca (nom. illeg.) TaxID=47850 RepID=UPI0033D65A73
MFAFLAAKARRLAGLALLVLLTAGVPYALIRYVGWPLPRQVPAWQDVATALTSPLTDTILGNTLVGLLWVAWAAFIWSLVAEVAEAVTGIRLPQPRAIAPARGLAALLIAAITGSVLATAAQAAPALTPPAIATGHDATVTAAATATGGPDAPLAEPAVRDRTLTTEADRPAMRLAAGQITLVAAGDNYTCTVRHGDTLSEIAEDWLGDANRWPEIWALNRGTHFDTVGGTFSNPHLIYPGWTLELPEDAVPPAAARPTPPADPPPPADKPATAPKPPAPDTSASEPARPETAPPQPSRTADRPGDDGVTGPAPAETAMPATPAPPTPSRTPSSPAATTPAPDSSPSNQSERPHGIALLTGSWIDLGLAIAIAAAAALVWTHRRRRYQPRPPGVHARTNDPDLEPMPAVITQIRRGLRAETGKDTDGLDILDTASPLQASTGGPAADDDSQVAHVEDVPASAEAPAGAEERDTAPVPVVPALDNPLAAVWPPAGLGLTGPGAEAAGRGFLTAALAAGGADNPDARSWVVIPSATAATLLGAAAVALPETPRLTVTGGLDDALTILEEQTLHRTRLAYQHEVDTIAEVRRADPYEEPQPPILFIADAAASHERARIAALLTQGQRLDIHGILLGPWPDGNTAVVDADGTTTPADGETRHGTHPADVGRLSVLTPAETIDLLTALAEAHTGERRPPAPTETPQPATGPDPGSQSVPAAGTDADDSADDGDPDRPLPVDAEPTPAVEDPAPVVAHPRDPAAEHAQAAEEKQSAPPGGRVEVRVLGDARIVDMDTSVPLRAKALELLVYLVVHDGDAAQDNILEDLLPYAPASKAPHRLHTYVSTLRKTLARTGGPATYLTHPPRRYTLNREALDTDLWRMRDALRDAERATTDADRTAALQRAVDAYDGALADGSGYEWIEAHREGIRRQALDAHLALATATADPTRALAILEAAMRHDPYAEALYQQAMRAHAAMGHLEQIRTLRRTLARRLDEIDAEPSDDTIKLADRLIAALQKQRPTGKPDPREGGQHP